MKSNGIQLRVGDLLYALQKRWKLITALTFLGLVFGLMLSALTYVQGSLNTYEVKGSFAVSSKDMMQIAVSTNPSSVQNYYHLAEDMADAVTYLLKSDRVLDTVINEQQMIGLNAEMLKNSITVSRYYDTQILDMTLIWNSDLEGLNLWNNIVSVTSRIMPETIQLGSLEIINPATAKIAGVGGSSRSTWAILAVLGFAAGAGIAVMELLMHPTLTNVRDVESVLGLETLGTIPRDDRYFKRRGSLLVQDDSVDTDVIQNYAAAAYIIRNRLGTREKHHCFYVTSTVNREGRSSAAANLAIQLSDMEHKTLLIDFDTRNPSLAPMFLNSVDYAHSLNALYRGEATMDEAITTLTGYLDLLPTVLEHNAILMDGVIVELIRSLYEKYEYIIIDAPPVGVSSGTLSLNQVANTVLFVVGYDMATVPDIQASLEKLDKSGIRVLGCIANMVQSSLNRSGDSDTGGRKRRRGKKKRDAEEAFFVSANERASDEAVNNLVNASQRSAGQAEAASGKKKKSRARKEKQQAAQTLSQEPVKPAAGEAQTRFAGFAMLDEDSGRADDKKAAAPASYAMLDEERKPEGGGQTARKPLSNQDAMDALLRMGAENRDAEDPKR